MSTQAPESEPEVLTTGMDPLSRATKRGILIAVLILAAIAAGFGTWKLWPRPPEPFSQADLQGVYAGMVRSDGTNDASVLSRDNFADSPATVEPQACEPLFGSTAFSRFPADAIDGVGTYWPNDRVAISLFTFRFADPADAQRQFEQINTAVGGCAGEKVELLPQGRDEPTQRSDAQSGVVSRATSAPLDGVKQQTAYLFTTDGVKFAVEVIAYNNLVSWQFRYDPQPGAYDPTAADQLAYSLVTQMRSVEEARP